jgi:hypothetical protein
MFTPFLKSRSKDDLIIDLLLGLRREVARSERNTINAINKAVKEILDSGQAPAARLVLKIGSVTPQ